MISNAKLIKLTLNSLTTAHVLLKDLIMIMQLRSALNLPVNRGWSGIKTSWAVQLLQRTAKPGNFITSPQEIVKINAKLIKLTLKTIIPAHVLLIDLSIMLLSKIVLFLHVKMVQSGILSLETALCLIKNVNYGSFILLMKENVSSNVKLTLLTTKNKIDVNAILRNLNMIRYQENVLCLSVQMELSGTNSW